MRKFISFLCGIFMIVTIFPGAAFAKSKPPVQNFDVLSTWLWDTAKIISEPDRIIGNLVDRRVHVLLLQIDPEVEIRHYKAFISKAAAKGIDVHALDGAPEWAGINGTALQMQFLEWLDNYQASASRNEQFKGIHLDVEPYEHEQYEEHMDDFIERYQSMMIEFSTQSERLGIEFGIDIPFWVKGTIAVETGRLADGYKFVTFYEENLKYMNQQLSMVYEHYESHPAFLNIKSKRAFRTGSYETPSFPLLLKPQQP